MILYAACAAGWRVEHVKHRIVDMEIDQVADAPANRCPQFRLRDLGRLDHHQLVVADPQNGAAGYFSQRLCLHHLLKVGIDTLVRKQGIEGAVLE